MAYSGTLGALLQGVSQQPAYIRSDGQVTEQINFIPDVTEGLTTRPGTVQTAIIPADNVDHTWFDVIISGELYQVGYRSGGVVILDIDGVEQTVTGDYPEWVDYFNGERMSSYVYDDDVFVTNRSVVVETNPDLSEGAGEVLEDCLIATCLGGLFGNTYTLKIRYSDGTTLDASYTAPDGSNSGDAAKSASDYIVNQLKNAFNSDPQLKTGTLVKSFGSTLAVYSRSGELQGATISSSDGNGDATFRLQGTTAEAVSDLARYAPHGALVKIVGSEDADDDFWLRFESSIDTARVGDRFGQPGIWREWYNPSEINEFNLATMPHKITKSGSTFTITKGNWVGRRTGDEETNGMPSFVGQTIRDISGFQSRLVFISSRSTIMSRTNLPTDFFKETATTSNATDPIDVISTSETEFTLDWLVPFDRDLVVMAKGSQFLITGTNALTPSNASMVETTKFSMSIGARPVSTGRTILFPFQSGGYAGVKEFYSVNSVDANEAISITQVQDKYMRGAISKMVTSTNFSIVLCKVDAEEFDNFLFAYQYYYDGEEKIQSAWYKLAFSNPVRHSVFDGSRVYILLEKEDQTGYIQTYIDLDIPEDDVGFNVSLDRRQKLVATDYDYRHTAVTREISGCKAVQGIDCLIPGATANVREEIDNEDGTFTYLLNKSSVPVGSSVYLGLKYVKILKPTMPLYRDRAGKVVSNTKLVVSDFAVYYEDSGYINVINESKYRVDNIEMNNRSLSLDFDPDDPDKKGISSGVYNFPWGERSDWSELTISSDDVRPVTITEIEWFGQILSRGKRI